MFEVRSGIGTLGEPKPALDHVPALDGVRGLAVFMVFVFHFSQGMPDLNLPRPLEQGLRLLTLGQKGVDLFFVLSGFLITGILMRTKQSPHYLRNFYIRRVLRIFPLYFAVVFLCLLWGWIWSLPGYAWSKNWWYALYLQNVGMTFWPGAVAGPGHFWSLAVEEHFYLFWPFVVLACSRKGLAIFALALIVAAGAFRLLLLSAGYDVFTFTLCRMDALALGALLAVCFRGSAKWNAVSRWTRRLFWPAFLAGIPAFFIFSGTHHPVQQAVKYLVFAGFCGGLLVLALQASPNALLPRLFINPLLRFMGKISYAMYVFHPWVCGWLGRISTRPAWSPLKGHVILSTLADFALMVGATILAAWLSWVLFENPILKLKEKFEYEPVLRPSQSETALDIAAGEFPGQARSTMLKA